jgi:purine-binding chemotaxis protein CheW
MRSQVCTFYLDGQLFGIPVAKVQEVTAYQKTTCVPLAPVFVKGLINLRGEIVTVIDLRRRLALEKASSERLPVNLVIRHGDGAISLLVDSIGDVVEVEERDFVVAPEILQGLARQLIQGAYKLEDRLLLMLDTETAVAIDDDGMTNLDAEKSNEDVLVYKS